MGYCTVLGDMHLVVWEVQLDILHRNVRAGRNENKHAMVLTRQNVLMVSAAAVISAAVAAVDAFAAASVARGAVKPIVAVAREAANPIVDVAREAVKPIAAVAALEAAKSTALLVRRMLMTFAVASAASVATASTVPSSPAAAPLAAASRLCTCSQDMGAADTSVPRPRVLDPSQDFSQFIGVSVCHQ